MKKFEDIDLVNYIINQGATLKQAAEYFEVSVDTVKKRIATIKKNLKEDSEISNGLNEVAQKNSLLGRQIGGQSTNSGRPRSMNIDEIREKAIIMLSKGLTIDEAALEFGIPSTTLHKSLELLNSEKDKEIYYDLKSMYEAHIRNKSNKEGFNAAGLQRKYTEKLEETLERKNSL